MQLQPARMQPTSQNKAWSKEIPEPRHYVGRQAVYCQNAVCSKDIIKAPQTWAAGSQAGRQAGRHGGRLGMTCLGLNLAWTGPTRLDWAGLGWTGLCWTQPDLQSLRLWTGSPSA